MVGEDLAQAGDHVRRAATLRTLDAATRQAVIAERVRGADCETIAVKRFVDVTE
jgi:hypothetical protein